MVSFPPTLARHILGGETGNLERAFVDGKAGAVGTVGPDQHRDVVDRPLHFTLGFERLLFGPLSVLDVCDRSIPSDKRSGFIARRRRSKQEPAILAVETSKARLTVGWLRRGNEPGAKCDEPVFIVGVERLLPAEAPRRLKRCASVFEPLLVEVLNITIG